MFSLSPTTTQNAFYGISQENSTWEDGKPANLERVKNMEKEYKSFPINTSTKANSLMAKRTAQVSLNLPMVIFTMVSGLKVSRMVVESISMLPPELFTAGSGSKARRMVRDT